jgi:hypothetical protein
VISGVLIFPEILTNLTPGERWRAAGDFGMGSEIDRWFAFCVVGTLFLLVLLCLLYLVLNRKRKQHFLKQVIIKHAERLKLDRQEFALMIELVNNAEGDRKDTVFCVAEHFESVEADILSDMVSNGEDYALIDAKRAHFQSLRDKLSFDRLLLDVKDDFSNGEQSSSRFITEGLKVRLRRGGESEDDEVEAVVVDNSRLGISLKLKRSLKVSFHDLWIARYNFKSSVLEYCSSMITYDGGILVLKHSDNIHFIRRRRFARVSINKPGFVARFPFMRDLGDVALKESEGSLLDGIEEEGGATLGPPEFVCATVTEIGGPGLKIEVPFVVESGERIVVVFRLDSDGGGLAHGKQISTTSKIIEAVGIVHGVQPFEGGSCAGVELKGCSHYEVDELVRATNRLIVTKNIEAEEEDSSEELVQSEVGKA